MAPIPIPPAARGSAASPWPEGRYGVALAVILAAGLGARLLYLAQFAAFPFFDHPVGDSAAHLARAAEIAGGKLVPTRALYYCSIFYPYFLAAVRALFGGRLIAVAAIQLVAGIAVATVLAATARRVFGAV